MWLIVAGDALSRFVSLVADVSSQTRNGKRSLGASQMGWMDGILGCQQRHCLGPSWCSAVRRSVRASIRAGSPANGLARVDNCKARSLQQRLAPLTNSPGGPACAAPQWTSCYLRCSSQRRARALTRFHMSARLPPVPKRQQLKHTHSHEGSNSMDPLHMRLLLHPGHGRD